MPGAPADTFVRAASSGSAADPTDAGDPGVIHDADTAAEDLPAYQGPPEPLAAHTHEWGADVAAEAGLPEP